MVNLPEASLIVIENLCKSFDDGAEAGVLNNISINIKEGDLVSLIGPSGCGKSTFLRCLNCLELLDSGYIRVGDVELSRKSVTQKPDERMLDAAHKMRVEVGMVFQGYNSLFPHKTVIQNIMLGPLVVKKTPEPEARETAVKLLKKVGLESLANKYPSTLSGGESQRAAIARALAMNPKVMLYDEPTSALDPELVGEVLQVMKDLDSEGMTQIIVTHEMQFARDASDYIVFMDKGEIVEFDDGDVLFTNPKNSRTKEFLRHFTGTGMAVNC
ncbi:MAG: amino acid ABC transporter ATP-binding protein [Synergistaceae bacterium]|jgi:polar amino acid transport system ATP-binding protein|nr:amino acid ABC transporter ATP-binding protein [Synergistaceae bacterium]